MRRTILGIMVALLGAGCGFGTPSLDDPEGGPASIQVQPSASPYSQITAGPVHALVPSGWEARPAGSPLDPRAGFIASPRPEAWQRMDGSISGMAATWVDATRVGVPSDFYYLAASGPLMSSLTHSEDCQAERRSVILDHRPSFAAGTVGSHGDYMVSAEGTCDVRGHPTRWEYFVAAPGFGPVRELGIPTSGLYVVVAVMRDSGRAEATLSRMIRSTSFAGSSVPDFLAVAHGRAAE